ncbi:sucrase/ferredoxin-like family protein [Actinidia rufa]|uniref:Sucrase/ferredoxin-like family protein n=1 Tax=Actinidia rufa TaxID=165716 RepID=A0A7J0G971_9ERIC|nr:sucrase/ferredoxin-like family protein [Actinidia rufa]
MGLSEEDQTRSLELRLQVNGGSNVERITNEPTQANEISRDACGSQVEVVGCQPNGSSSCCQNPSEPENTDNHDLNEREAKLTAEKKSSKRQISLHNSGKGASTRRVCSMPTWFENWEREDTYAALAVVGAALSVAFAYRCYKQLT